MKRILIAIGCCVWVLAANATDPSYAVSNIPKELMTNAHVVKRMEQTVFEIVNPGEAILRNKYALTILDENGDRYATFTGFYDKLQSIRNVEGVLYDAQGKELKRLKNKQVIDLSGVSDNNLYDDNRAKVHSFYCKNYPYTVQYEVEIKYNGTLFFPTWLPREGEYYSVEQSSISISSPANYTVRYKAFNYAEAPAESMEKDKKVLTWKATNLPAIVDEYASPEWNEINTMVLFGPSDFEVENYRGNMNSWQEFGKFVYALKQGRDELPDKVKQDVHRIADNIADKKEKIARLYDYLQKNTRYISVQLGIGGWQPFDAKYVASKAYGDCKALTNYMYSLLKEAGIDSRYTLVRAGENARQIIADFPSSQFNHVILSVPLPGDTMWLECTSQTLPAGYLGDFTCNRQALVVDEKGGTLVRTPRYGVQQNLQQRTIKATLDSEATLKVSVKTVYTGLQQDMYHSMIHSLSNDKIKEYLHSELDFATYDIGDFNYKEKPSALPSVEENLAVTVSNYASMTGKRLFIVPNVMTRTGRKLSPDVERKNDILLKTEYNDVDSVEIILPAGFTAESIPQEVSISSKFGRYRCSVKFSGDRIYYYRDMEQFSGRFPPKDYPDLVKFYESIYKADRNKVVLVRTEGSGEKKPF